MVDQEAIAAHRLTAIVVIAVSGGVGVALRYGVGSLITARVGGSFPWSTLTINIVGALALGALAALILPTAGGGLLLPALAIGLLGGFTTFSTFALDAIVLAQDGRVGAAIGYVAATNIGGIAAAAIALTALRSAS